MRLSQNPSSISTQSPAGDAADEGFLVGKGFDKECAEFGEVGNQIVKTALGDSTQNQYPRLAILPISGEKSFFGCWQEEL